jgi:nucleotide-binding universal stress UspA family protein
MGDMKTIVVGTDGSDSSLVAVAQAAELAAGLGGTLNIACVVQMAKDLPMDPMAPAMVPTGYDQQVLDAGNAAVAKAAEVATAKGADVQTYIRHGEPSHALIELCEEVEADLLVVGSRGMTGAARFLLGSVPNRCAHHAPCSVMIVRTN